MWRKHNERSAGDVADLQRSAKATVVFWIDRMECESYTVETAEHNKREREMGAMSRLAADVQELLDEGYTPAEIARVLNIEESLIDPRAFDTLYDGMDDYESDDGYVGLVTGCDPAEDAYLDASYEDRFDTDFDMY